MGELRRDPVINRWVIIDPERVEREAVFPLEEEAEEPIRSPFETWILPKGHLPDFGRITEEEVEDLADILKTVMGMLQTSLAFSSGSLILHTSPLHDYHRPEYHWHIEIVPKASKVAGFEWGTGFFVNPIPPEEATARLKEGRQARLEGI